MSFHTDLARGQVGERFMDLFFADEFFITEPPDAQSHGYDRQFIPWKGGEAFTVEYKWDTRAATTNNAFVETVSVDYAGKRGWAYTSEAQKLMYAIPAPLLLVYVIPMAALRAELPRFERDYREVSVQNDGYQTKGCIVPLAEFEAIAEAVIDIS